MGIAWFFNEVSKLEKLVSIGSARGVCVELLLTVELSCGGDGGIDKILARHPHTRTRCFKAMDMCMYIYTRSSCSCEVFI